MATKKELEKHYRDITSLYDLSEELASTVESKFIQDPEAQLAIVEPLISKIADSADILAEEFITVLETPSRKKSAKNRIESALRKIFIALEEYRSTVGLKSKKLMGGLINIADPIVDKIRKQVEKIVLIFMQLIQVSLERIMHKFEIEEFKRTNQKAVSQLSQIGITS